MHSRAGQPVPDHRAGQPAFPDPEDIAVLEPDGLRRPGSSATKAPTSIELGRATVTGHLDLNRWTDPIDDAWYEHFEFRIPALAR